MNVLPINRSPDCRLLVGNHRCITARKGSAGSLASGFSSSTPCRTPASRALQSRLLSAFITSLTTKAILNILSVTECRWLFFRKHYLILILPSNNSFRKTPPISHLTTQIPSHPICKSSHSLFPIFLAFWQPSWRREQYSRTNPKENPAPPQTPRKLAHDDLQPSM